MSTESLHGNVMVSGNETLSSVQDLEITTTRKTLETDQEGQMQFVVAVVLVYGVFVIGVIWLDSRRKVHQEQAEKEAVRFLKIIRKRENMDKHKRLTTVNKLLVSLHGTDWNSSHSSSSSRMKRGSGQSGRSMTTANGDTIPHNDCTVSIWEKTEPDEARCIRTKLRANDSNKMYLSLNSEEVLEQIESCL